MKVFSAAEVVSPAIDRTRRYLFQPFTWGTYLKLSAVACVTEGFSANFNMSLPQDLSSGTGSSTPFNLSSEMIALIVIGVLVCFASGIFIFYLVTRLPFAFFHCLVHKTKDSTGMGTVWCSGDAVVQIEPSDLVLRVGDCHAGSAAVRSRLLRLF